MSSMGMENLDSWGESSSQDAQPRNSANSGTQPGGSGAAGGADGSGDSSSSEQGGGGAAPKPAGVTLQQHRSAVLSLLRQRLSKMPGSKASGSTAEEAPAPPAEQPAPAVEGSSDAAEECAGTPSKGDAATLPTAARPCSPPMATPAPPTAGSCSSSMADTPFGTPMAILPSCLLHPSSDGAPAEAAAGGDGEAAAGGAAAGSHPDHGLPSEGGQLLDAKPEGSVLVGAPSQGEAGDHSEHTLFQIE